MSADAPAASSSQSDQMSSGYVSQKISEAQAQGKDVRLAKAQQAMGEAALKKGMNNEAAQHFETALRSIGVMPNAPGETAGEGSSEHHKMPNAVD
jgi:hypothetical protein